MIQFKCPECGRSIEAPEHKSCKRFECPNCLEIVLVPKQSVGRFDGSGLLPWLGVGLTPVRTPSWPGDEEDDRDWRPRDR